MKKIGDWISGRVFQAVHGRNLVYNTCWEDPRLDKIALELGPSDNLLVITSAGCNSLSYALTGLNAYKISARAALTSLTRTDDEVCSKIDGPEPLSRSQKACLITHIRKHFMFEFLSQAEAVMDYLSNNDWSSVRIG